MKKPITLKRKVEREEEISLGNKGDFILKNYQNMKGIQNILNMSRG